MQTMKNFFDGKQGLALQRVVNKLFENGFICYLAGGCVRDSILQKPYKDLDLVTSATPEQVQALFPNHIAVGKKFGIIVVLQDGESFEVATFRKDGDYQDGRHPEQVQFASPQEDAQRRDFTVNALFYDLKNNQILDFVSGQNDISAKLIKAVGNPQKRFQEDYLRILRALRFQAQLGFTIEENTWLGLQAEIHSLKKISGERISQELFKGTSSNCILFYNQLQKSGAWDVLFDNIKNYGWKCKSLNLNEELFHKPEFQKQLNTMGSSLALLMLMAKCSICEDAFILISSQEIQWNTEYLKFVIQIFSFLKLSKQDEFLFKNLAAIPCWIRHWAQLRVAFRLENLFNLKDTFFLNFMIEFLKYNLLVNDTDSLNNIDYNKTNHDINNHSYNYSNNYNYEILINENQRAQQKPSPFIIGSDVMAILPQHRSKCLKEALYLQWEEKINSREEALNWLSRYVKLESK